MIEMEYVKSIINNREFKLFGEEKRLYSYLVEGKDDLILPSLVADVHKILYHKKEKKYHYQTEETKKLLER